MTATLNRIRRALLKPLAWLWSKIPCCHDVEFVKARRKDWDDPSFGFGAPYHEAKCKRCGCYLPGRRCPCGPCRQPWRDW